MSRTDPVTVTVEAGAGGVASTGPAATPLATDSASEQKNVLTAGGLRPLRYQAHFVAPATPLWRRAFFLPAVLAPVGLLFGRDAARAGAREALRADRGRPRPKQQAKAARKRLAAAEKLRGRAAPAPSTPRWRRRCTGFLEARLRMPVGGLTREALGEKMTAAGVDARAAPASALRARGV